MRKWVFTYCLVFFFLLFYVNSIGAVWQSVQFTAVKESNTKSKPILVDSPLQNKSQKSFAEHAESIAPLLSSVHFIEENIFFMYFPGLYSGEISSASVTKQDMKDYLLHLFPSHYFW